MTFNQSKIIVYLALGLFFYSMLTGCTNSLPQLPSYVASTPAREEEMEVEQPFVEASPKSRIGGIMEYLHDPMREYAIYAKLGGLTPIALTPGSRLSGVSISNPEGWRIDDRQSYGSGRSTTPLVVVSPGPGSKATTAVVTTQASDGMFMLKLIPHRTGFSQVKFVKPQKSSSSQAKTNTPNIAGAGGSYSLQGDRTSWQPLSVRDDGTRTYVELQSGSEASEVPVVMAIGPNNETRPVNARKQGNVLVVDGIHTNGIRLSLGEQTIEARRF